MEPATVELYPSGKSFQDLVNAFQHLQNGEIDRLKVFKVEGGIAKKRRMSKSLFFIEIIPLQAEDENSELVLLQIILEASLEEREKGFSEEFTTKFSLLVREVHLGDVVTATGSPQKWNNGRVCLKLDKIELVSRFRDDFPGAYFDAEKYRLQSNPLLQSKSHESTESDSGSSTSTIVPLCRAIARGLVCKNKKSCLMRHLPTATEAERTRIQLEKRKAILEAQYDPNDHSDDLKQSKSLRAEVFAKWLVEKFGVDRLNSDSGVLDVAGGVGGLSFELHVGHGVKTTLLEPRSLKLSKKQAKIVKEKELEIFDQIQAFFEEDLWMDPECPAAVKNCAVVVGLHPDQATEPIVDFSLSHNKPFAVVPCCVFPHLWPHRQLSSGKSVVDYTDFIEYLKQKDSRIKVEFLNLSGRNRVLFFDPSDKPC